ncbi:hypothetical protein M0804_000419 [Polistes exclamans]|nr:hypothetical protein M0804_000419 [Polistes exclamans]
MEEYEELGHLIPISGNSSRSAREEFKTLANVSIPRWFNTWTNLTMELQGFSDASQLAMSAVVYIVVSSPSTGTHSS